MTRCQVLPGHYLLISLTLAFSGGILLHHLLPLGPTAAFVPSLLLLPAALFCHRPAKSRLTLCSLLATSLALGFLHSALFTSLPLRETDISRRISTEEDAVLTGSLHSMVQFDGRKSSIIINSHSLRLQHEKFFSPVQGLVRLRLKGEWPRSLLPGAELVIRATLSPPYRFGNPGGFDYPAFLAAKNIRTVGRINSTAHIHPLVHDGSLLHSLRYFPEKVRGRLRDLIDKSLPAQQAAVYRALLIGDRAGLDSEVLESFKASGTMHILSISGLHLSLVASALFLLFYWLARRSQYLMLRFSAKKVALLATVPPLCGYALLGGAQTPVLRSLIMVLVFILAFCVQRRRSPFTTLSFAALLILLVNPLSLFTVSFQLSFAAVAALILILPRLESLLHPEEKGAGGTPAPNLLVMSWRWLTAALLVSIAATIGTAPLLAHSFNRLSTVGPLANLLMEPLLCLWSLPLGLITIPLLFIAPQYGASLLQIGAMGIKAALSVAGFFENYNFSTLWFPTPSISLILLYYLTLGLLCFNFPFRKTMPPFLIVCTLFAFPPSTLLKKRSTESELVFLDVGQGSSTLLTFPGGKTVLIDGGGASSPRFNVGESIIAPYLWHRGITHLDAVVITHPDADHFNGIPFLLKRFHPDTLWVNGEKDHAQGYDDLLNLAHGLGIRVAIPQDKELLMSEGHATLSNVPNPILGGEKFSSSRGFSANDKSLVLRFTVTEQGVTCLFPGDIGHKAEKILIDSNQDLDSSIFLAAHHGSKTSNSPLFLDKVRPELVVVSAGRFRPSHFPSAEIQHYSMTKDIPLLNTAETGAVFVRTTGSGVEISSHNRNSARHDNR